MVSYPNVIQVWLRPTPWLAGLEYVQGDRSILSVILLSSASPGASTPQAGLLLIMTPENQYQEEKQIESARQNPWKCHGALIKVNWFNFAELKTFGPLFCRAKQWLCCKGRCMWGYLLLKLCTTICPDTPANFLCLLLISTVGPCM